MLVPDFDRIGGYELQALSQAAHFRSRGLPVLLLTNHHPERPPREVRDGVVVQRLDPLPPDSHNWAALFSAFLTFLKHHRADYDVIHCHALTFLAACCARIGRLLRVPVLVKVATERDVREYRDNHSLHFRLFFRWLKGADLLLCLSESIQHEAVACGFRPERTAIMPNGVDSERFRPATAEQRAQARRDLGLAERELAFVYVGRLVQRKGVDVLLQALARAHDASAATLFAVGDGEERTALERQSRELGIADRVRFTGEQRAVQPWLHAADAFVFPSRLEGLPNALLEAMAHGLPVIATRIGGCTDVVTEGSGILVPSDDVPALASAIDRLAGDAALRAQLGHAARARIEERFAFARIGDELQQLYRSCLTAP
jgi:glycosyltransferase involved in cell wall biosynthesis